MQIKKSVMIFAIAALLVVPFASAGFFDFITGKASSQNTNLTVTVSNSDPMITLVNVSQSLTPNEGTFNDYVFEVIVYDHDGSRDINTTNTTVNVNFTAYSSNFAEEVRHAVCSLDSTIDDKSASYTCTVRFYYWDGAGFWNASASANDSSGAMAYNLSNVLTINNLAALTMTPNLISWTGLTPDTYNQTSTDHSMLNNTGNLVFYTGGVDYLQLNATNLSGAINPLQIGAELFAVGNATDPCGFDKAVENSFVNVTSYLGKGNLSANDDAKENIYYCLTWVPDYLEKQNYATTNAWTLNLYHGLGNN